MANVQVEDGHIKIAYSLAVAISQTDLNGIQMRTLLVIMNLTYGIGLAKAEITLDDIRYMMGSQVRSIRFNKDFDELVDANIVIADGKYIGIQKDFDKWCLDRSGRTNCTDYININIKANKLNTIRPYNLSAEKMSVPKLLVRYVYSQGTYKPKSIQQMGIEERNARQIYTKAVSHTLSPAEALLLVKDYLDYLLRQPWVDANVKMKLTYANGRFEAWLKQVPKKPRSVLQDEQITGKRHRYNVDKKKWEATDEKSAN